MAEISRFWTTNGTGDGSSGGYTQAQFAEFVRQTLMTSLTTEGVLKGIGNELAVSGASSPLTVASGSGLVYGLFYANDSSITSGSEVTIPTPSTATRIDRIVLRASWAAQTIRVFRIAGTEGLSAPALTQIANTTWDIPLATVSITTGGVITVTDGRTFVKTPGTFGYLDDSSIINAAQLATDSVTTAKILNANVTTAKIADLNVTTAKIADANVTEGKIATSAVTEAKIGTGAVTVTKIGGNAVTSAKIAADAVVTTSIINDAVTGAKIASTTITADNIVLGTITGNRIASTTVTGGTTGNIALTTITVANLADDAVTGAKILSGTITADNLASDSVTTAKILNANVTTAKILDANVTEAKIGTGAVTVTKIGAGAVTAEKLATDSVTTIKIDDDAVTGAKILDGTITAANLASDSVTTAKILNANVTAAKIASNTITASQIATAAIGSDELAADAVTGVKLGAYAIKFGGRQGGDSDNWSPHGVTRYDDPISSGFAQNEVSMSAGSIQISISGSSSGTVNVSFYDKDAPSSAMYATNPIVLATPNGSTDYIIDVSAVTTSGATIRATHKAGTSATTTVTVWWISIGSTTL